MALVRMWPAAGSLQADLEAAIADRQ